MSHHQYHFKALGHSVDEPQQPSESILEVIKNEWSHSDYEVTITYDTFCCLCPCTGKPDFAELLIVYRPDQYLIESKSLKLYLAAYHQTGIFQEFAINKICHDIGSVLQPRFLTVRGKFTGRGGVAIAPLVTWQKPQR